MTYANEVNSACGYDTSRPLIVAGNGPSILSLDYRQLPQNPYVFRCNWFFLEDHYRLGNRVDGYFWSVHNEGMLRGAEEASRIGGYDFGAFFTPVAFTDFGDSTSCCSKLSFTPSYNHWRIIAGQPELAVAMMMRPLPTQGMQMLVTALELGFREIYLVGIDFYQDPASRYAYQVPAVVADKWLKSKDLSPGYESCHEITVDLRMLQFAQDAYPDARIFNLGSDNPLLPKSTELRGTGEIVLAGKELMENGAVTPSKRRLFKELSFDGTPELKCAFVTCADDKFVHGVAALANSLSKVSEVPLIVMIPPGTDTGLFPKIGNIRIFFVESIREPGSLGDSRLSFADSCTKLNVFNLAFLDRAVFLDPDSLVLKNIDHLFSHSGFAVAPDFGFEQGHDRFNSGVFVCTPSTALFKDMLKRLSKLPPGDLGDQAFLHIYFDEVEHLDHRYNTLRQVSVEFPGIFDLAKVSVLNFGGVKCRDLFKPAGDQKFHDLTSLWFSHLPEQSKIALLHQFREAQSAAGAFNLRVSHKHFEIAGMVPAAILDIEALEIKPLEMARALMAIGRQDLARVISEACLRKNPESKAHQLIVQECGKPGGKNPPA